MYFYHFNVSTDMAQDFSILAPCPNAHYYYYYYFTIWMSLVTGLFFPVLLLN